MSELAIVSARTSRLRVAVVEQGSRAAKTALALAAVPGESLATVQIGITLVAVIAGASPARRWASRSRSGCTFSACHRTTPALSAMCW